MTTFTDAHLGNAHLAELQGVKEGLVGGGNGVQSTAACTGPVKSLLGIAVHRQKFQNRNPVS